jgi:hypothetical protein
MQTVSVVDFLMRPARQRLFVDRAALRGQVIDRIADVQFAADEIRDLAEHAGFVDEDFAAVDRVMQLLYDETNRLLERFEG